MALTTTGNTGIMGDGFGKLTPFDILQRLQKTYGLANNGTRGILNRWHTQCNKRRQVIISREHSTICREGPTSREKSEQVREQASST